VQAAQVSVARKQDECRKNKGVHNIVATPLTINFV